MNGRTKTNGGQGQRETEVSTRRKKYDDVTAVGSYLVQERRIQDYGLRLLFLFESDEMSQKRGEVDSLDFAVDFGVADCHRAGRVCLYPEFLRACGTPAAEIPLCGDGRSDRAGTDFGAHMKSAALDRQFSQLLKQLDRLIQKNYIQRLQKIRKQEPRKTAAELQINPHFLYNTLETMSSIAAVNQVFSDSATCAASWAKSFATASEAATASSLRSSQELHHTGNYALIQKIRYGNQFEVRLQRGRRAGQQADSALYPAANCGKSQLRHGMERMTTQGTLEISVTQKEENLLIKIEDDGVGMDQEQLQELCRRTLMRRISRKRKRRSIGVRNVHQRIKMICGEQYGIRIRSEVYRGSVFEIYLPMR